VIATGLFGDLAGNIERALATDASGPVAVVVEWADADPRLGLREGYPPSPEDEAAIGAGAAGRLDRLQKLLAAAASTRRIVLALPASPLPPWLPSLPGQASAFKLHLRALLASFASACAASGVRVVEAADTASAYDVRAHINSGFPYRNSYADTLAASLATLLLPATPAKGLVTDLDNTLWSGIAGDDGPSNVHWSLENHARPHGLYQQFLAGLSAQGVLLAVASKNDLSPVAEALRRSDLLVPSSAFYPVETNWGPKSESILRIARAWNIGLEDIVFVDDSPFELAEVRQALPQVECHAFPAGDSAAVLALLETLRLRFAREHVSEEDLLRASSLRNAQLDQNSPSSADPEALLARLDARVAVSFLREPFDPRALELLNKTNQFNLNGRRWEESQFRAFLSGSDAVLAVVSYEDRFGALGKIAVAVGQRQADCLRIKSWVMSCRAFSRRIEFSTLLALFDYTGTDWLELDWHSTPRNNPTRNTLLTLFADVACHTPLRLARVKFASACPPLYATVSYK